VLKSSIITASLTVKEQNQLQIYCMLRLIRARPRPVNE